MKTIRAMFLVAASPLALCASVAHADEAMSAGQATAGAPQANSAAHAAAPQGDAASTVQEIVVTGTRASLESAERAKRRAAVMIDGISSDNIGQMPDVSISESLIRIAGVTSNDTNRGSDQVAIRGLGPDLVSTEYNGRVLPTADGVTRRVGLAGLPTEGISSAWAQKTPDAATIEGGVAGILELETIHPLETSRRGLTLVGRGLYSDTADATGVSPFGGRGEVTYVARPTSNFGFTFSYAGIKESAGENGVQLDGWRLGTGARADLNGDGKPDALPTTAGSYGNSFVTERHSLVTMAQWDPTSSIRVSLDALYDNDHYVQNTTQYAAFNIYNGAALGAATSSTVSNADATAFAGPVGGYRGILNRSDIHDHTYETGLNVAYNNGGRFKAKFDASWSEAGRDRQTPTVNFENDAVAGKQTLPFDYDATDPTRVTFDFSSLPVNDYNLATANTVSQYSHDEISAARGDFTYDTKSFIDSLQWGFRIDHRDHWQDVTTFQYSFANVAARPGLDSSDLAGATNPETRASGAYGGASAVNFPYYNFDKLLQIGTTAPGVIVNNQFASNVATNGEVREMDYAAYGQANLAIGKLTGNVGARWFQTHETVLGQAGTNPSNVVSERFDHEYNYLLPSMNLRYEFTPKLIGRFAASKTMSRPVFGDLGVGDAVNLTTAPVSGVVTEKRGNPDLKPFTSKGIDVGLEWYASKSMSFAFTYYYKWVTNFTTQNTTQTTVTMADGTVLPAALTETINDPKTEDFRGFELQARRDFTFLPGIWSALGVQGNWNHNATGARDMFNSLVGHSVAVLPINVSKDVVNAQLYYSRGGVDIRMAYRYYSQYSRTVGSVYQIQPGGQFDFNAGFQLNSNLRLIASATNIFGTHMEKYTVDYRNPSSDTMLEHYTYQGRQITLGLRAQF